MPANANKNTCQWYVEPQKWSTCQFSNRKIEQSKHVCQCGKQKCLPMLCGTTQFSTWQFSNCVQCIFVLLEGECDSTGSHSGYLSCYQVASQLHLPFPLSLKRIWKDKYVPLSMFFSPPRHFQNWSPPYVKSTLSCK